MAMPHESFEKMVMEIFKEVQWMVEVTGMLKA